VRLGQEFLQKYSLIYTSKDIMSFLTKMSYFIYDVNNIFGTVLQYALKHKDFEDAIMLNGLSRVTHV